MKIGIVSAEPSGDLLGSKILSKIKERFENIEVIGVGGGPLTDHNISTDREMLEIMWLVDPILNFQKIINYRKNKKTIWIGSAHLEKIFNMAWAC